jgi:hypothetical protein
VTDVDAVVALSPGAWAPVFARFERVLGPRVLGPVHPGTTATRRPAPYRGGTGSAGQPLVRQHRSC